MQVYTHVIYSQADKTQNNTQNSLDWKNKTHTWVQVQNFQNLEFFEIQILKIAVCLQNINISSFNGKLSLDKL